jgi:hypothetical protein
MEQKSTVVVLFCYTIRTMEGIPFDKESMEYEGVLPRNLRRKYGLPEYGPSGLTPEEEQEIYNQELNEKIESRLHEDPTEDIKEEESKKKKIKIPWYMAKRVERWGLLSRRLRIKHGLPEEGETGLTEEQELEIRRKEGGENYVDGFANEKKVLDVFIDNQSEWPEWLKGVYKATPDQDRKEKTDIVFVTTAGEFRGQIKSRLMPQNELRLMAEMGIIPILNTEKRSGKALYHRILRQIREKVEKTSL